MSQVELIHEVDGGTFQLSLYRILNPDQDLVGRISLVRFDVDQVNPKFRHWTYFDDLGIRRKYQRQGYGRFAIDWVNQTLETDNRFGILYNAIRTRKMADLYLHHGWQDLTLGIFGSNGYQVNLRGQLIDTDQLKLVYYYHEQQCCLVDEARPAEYYDMRCRRFFFPEQ